MEREREKLLEADDRKYYYYGESPEDRKQRRRRTVLAVLAAVAMSTLAVTSVRYVVNEITASDTSFFDRLFTKPEDPPVSGGEDPFPLANIDIAKLYYINLDASTDRRTAMETMMAAQYQVTKVPYERVRAVLGESSDDLSRELGTYLVSHLGCVWHTEEYWAASKEEKHTCPYNGNNGLCCMDQVNPYAALNLLDENYNCTHETAHTWSSRDASHSSCFHMMANWASHIKALSLARDELSQARPDSYVLIFEDDVIIQPDWLFRLKSARFAKRDSQTVLEPILSLAAHGNTNHKKRTWDYIRADLDAYDVSLMTTEANAIIASVLAEQEELKKDQPPPGAHGNNEDQHDDLFHAVDVNQEDTNTLMPDGVLDLSADSDSSSSSGDGADDSEDDDLKRSLVNPLFAAVDWNGVPATTFFAFGAGALLVRIGALNELINSVSDCLDIDFALNIGSVRGNTKMATLAYPVFTQNMEYSATSTMNT